MLGNKSFSASAYDVISEANKTAKYHKRSLGTIDILSAIISEDSNAAGKVLRKYNLSSNATSLYYSQIVEALRAENFSLESFCNFANKISEASEDNVITAEHLYLTILANTNCLARQFLAQQNIDLSAIELDIADMLERPGFIYSYLDKSDFWLKHFDNWVLSHPSLFVVNWEYKINSDIAKGSTFLAISEDKNCGIIIKDSKGSEFLINVIQDKNGKFIVLNASRRDVQVVQTCFISFALGRLAFKEDKT